LRLCCNRLGYLPCNIAPLGYKRRGRDTPTGTSQDNFNITSIVTSNTRTQNVELLSSGRSEAV
jgi:hypothetical protein